MNIIDSTLHEHQIALEELGSGDTVITITATKEAENYYVGYATGISDYIKDLLILLSINETSNGTVTLNINDLGVKSVMVRDKTGALVNVTGTLMKKDTFYVCIYDGTQWVTTSVLFASDAYNVSDSINGVLISDIFETDGKTVKQATISEYNKISVPATTPTLMMLGVDPSTPDGGEAVITAETAVQYSNGSLNVIGNIVPSGKLVGTADNATNVTTNINGKAINNIFEVDGITAKNATNAATAVNVSTNIGGHSLSSIFESNGTTVKAATTASTATNATNVTTNINGKAITTIFESNGTTVKNATNSVNATNIDAGYYS